MTTTAAIYCRQSLDRTGQGLAVARQLTACRKLVKANGWKVGEVFTDNDTSATKGVPRIGFDALLKSNPDAIVVWHIDRLVRLTKDLERVIELGVNVYAVSAGHLNLSNPAGRAVARTVTAWATYEGEQKALRQKASNDQRAESGRPHCGRRPFGYTSTYEVDETEAGEVRIAVDSLLAGGSIRGIVSSMGKRGVRTTAGNPWRPTEMRRLLANPRYAGLRVHRGEVVGRAAWPAIIDDDTHNALCAILGDPARHKAGPPRRTLLSGLARCGTCGAPVYGVTENRGKTYYCQTRRHVARRAEDIDELVVGVIIERLSRQDAAALLSRNGERDRAKLLRDDERGLRGRLDGLAEAFAVGDIDQNQLRAGSRRLRARLELVSTELTSLARSPILTGLLTGDVATAWDALDLDSQRAVVETLIDVVIASPGRGARRFDPKTITIAWKSA